MKKKFLLLALPAAAFAAPAYAQDAPLGGFRLEATVGYDNLSADALDEDFDDDPLVAQPTGDLEGAYYGLGIGYDFAFGGLMLGVDGEITESDNDRSFFAIVTGTTPQSVAKLEVERDLYVGGRATFAISPNFNTYLKVGYTNLRLAVKATDDDVQDELEDIDDLDLDANLDGIRAGIGFAYAPEGRVSYGLEFRYSNYEAGFERRQAAFVLGYRF